MDVGRTDTAEGRPSRQAAGPQGRGGPQGEAPGAEGCGVGALLDGTACCEVLACTNTGSDLYHGFFRAH